jgi:hypothetical protein
MKKLVKASVQDPDPLWEYRTDPDPGGLKWPTKI